MQVNPRGWKALAVAGGVTLASVGIGLAPKLGEVEVTQVAFPYGDEGGVVAAHPEAAASRILERTASVAEADRARAARRAELRAQELRAKAMRVAARQAAAAAQAETPYDFVISAFNILGSNHTRPGSDADHFAPGRVRTEWAADIVAAHGSSIVGWSEIQGDQVDAFMRTTGGAFEAWPGFELGAPGVPASLMWRTDIWRALERYTVDIPFIGQTRPMPYVKLEHLATGRKIWVMNVHNAPNDRSAERNVAESRELAIIRDLAATGLPTFFIGDMNEKAEIFCEVTGTTSLVSASGGSNDGVCRPPAAMRVDWIFGTPNVEFSDYRADRSPIVARTTDHAVLVSRVTVP